MDDAGGVAGIERGAGGSGGSSAGNGGSSFVEGKAGTCGGGDSKNGLSRSTLVTAAMRSAISTSVTSAAGGPKGICVNDNCRDSPAPNLEVLQAISETLRRGAEANITYFESLIIEPWAQEYGIHPDLAKYYFQQADNEYLVSVAAVGGAQFIAGSMLKEEAKASVNLGSSLTAYAKSAALIAKYYSLGAQVDDTGYVTGYDRQSSLANLVLARGYSVRQTEELVRAALAGRSAKARKPSRSPLENDLSQKIGLPVRVQQGSDGAGRLTIRFKQKSELDKLVRLLR